MVHWKILENHFEATAVIDDKLSLIYANKRFRELAQITAEASSASLSIRDFLVVDESVWAGLKTDRYLKQTPQILSLEFAFGSSSKGFAQILIDRLPADVTGGHPVFLLVLRDITFELESKAQLNENEKLITNLKRNHAEAHFLWRLSMETPLYIEPRSVLEVILKRMRTDLGFTDACFIYTPKELGEKPRPVVKDPRIGSRLRQVALRIIPELLRRSSRTDVFDYQDQKFGHFWITSFRPKSDEHFYLLARFSEGEDLANRRAFFEPLASQITGWLENRAVYLSSITDALTGLYNRRHFDSRFSVECLIGKGKQNLLSLILVDIDFFKKINDSFGHQVGDQVLKAVASSIKSVLRANDLVARIGGEEFAILLLDTSPQDAQLVAEKIRKTVSETPVRISEIDQEIRVTISSGITGLATASDSPESLYRDADEALYRAKEAGRNRVELSASIEDHT